MKHLTYVDVISIASNIDSVEAELCSHISDTKQSGNKDILAGQIKDIYIDPKVTEIDVITSESNIFTKFDKNATPFVVYMSVLNKLCLTLLIKTLVFMGIQLQSFQIKQLLETKFIQIISNNIHRHLGQMLIFIVSEIPSSQSFQPGNMSSTQVVPPTPSLSLKSSFKSSICAL